MNIATAFNNKCVPSEHLLKKKQMGLAFPFFSSWVKIYFSPPWSSFLFTYVSPIVPLTSIHLSLRIYCKHFISHFLENWSKYITSSTELKKIELFHKSSLFKSGMEETKVKMANCIFVIKLGNKTFWLLTGVYYFDIFGSQFHLVEI